MGSAAPPTSAFAPAPAGLRRLTSSQYVNAIHELLGSAINVPGNLEPDDKRDTFSSLGAYRATLSQNGAEKFADAGFDIAYQVFSNATAVQTLVGCKPTSATDPCIDTFLQSFGRRVFRRPLTGDELARYKNVVTVSAGEQASVLAGVQFAVAALLQAVDFLYVPEVGEPDPQDRSRLRYTGYEMASRLSFTLWDTIPDAALLDAAEAGQLVTADGVRMQAERLIASNRAQAAVANFFAESYGYDDIEDTVKDKTKFPGFDAKVLSSMRAELDHLVGDYALGTSTSILDLLDARQSYVDKSLATLYGMAALPSAATGFTKITLPSERAGLLTTGALLATHAETDRTSPTRRGKFIREHVLCQVVPDPPPNVKINLDKKPATGPAPRTMREKLAAHATDPTCSACHSFIDPIGLALETFDGVGKYRTSDSGAPIDASGDMDASHFGNAKDLTALLKANPDAQMCFVRELYRASTGHIEGDGEKVVLDGLNADFGRNGTHFRALLADVVSSAGFRYAVKPQ